MRRLTTTIHLGNDVTTGYDLAETLANIASRLMTEVGGGTLPLVGTLSVSGPRNVEVGTAQFDAGDEPFRVFHDSKYLGLVFAVDADTARTLGETLYRTEIRTDYDALIDAGYNKHHAEALLEDASTDDANAVSTAEAQEAHALIDVAHHEPSPGPITVEPGFDNVVIEFHYDDGDVGVHPSEPGDTAERFWADQRPRQHDAHDLTHILVRLPTADDR